MKKGQSSDVFTMLIGSVFAVAMLLLIYSAVQSIEPPFSSFEVMKDIAQKAYKNKDLCFGQKVPFVKGEVLLIDKIVVSQDFQILHNAEFLEKFDVKTYRTITTVRAPVSMICDINENCNIYFKSGNCQ